MPNIFLKAKDVIQITSSDNYNSCSNSIKVSNFILLAKKQNPTNETTYFVKDFSLFAIFPFN